MRSSREVGLEGQFFGTEGAGAVEAGTEGAGAVEAGTADNVEGFCVGAGRSGGRGGIEPSSRRLSDRNENVC